MKAIYILIFVILLPTISRSQIPPVKLLERAGTTTVRSEDTFDPLAAFKHSIYGEIINFISENESRLPVNQFSFNISLGEKYELKSFTVSINANDDIKKNLERITKRLDFSDMIKVAKEMKWNDSNIIIPFIIFYETDAKPSFIEMKREADKSILNCFTFDTPSFSTNQAMIVKPKILSMGAVIR
jgi:hypothetical protein